jgi:hypothetical protein
LGVGVQIGDELTAAVGDVQSGEWGVTKRNLGVEEQIAPGIPMIARDVTEVIVGGGVSGVAPGG